jgi:hypothetical protein
LIAYGLKSVTVFIDAAPILFKEGGLVTICCRLIFALIISLTSVKTPPQTGNWCQQSWNLTFWGHQKHYPTLFLGTTPITLDYGNLTYIILNGSGRISTICIQLEHGQILPLVISTYSKIGLIPIP